MLDMCSVIVFSYYKGVVTLTIKHHLHGGSSCKNEVRNFHEQTSHIRILYIEGALSILYSPDEDLHDVPE